MKKLYVIGALASLYLSPTVNAQEAAIVVEDPIMQSVQLPTERYSPVAIDYSVNGDRTDYVMNDDFSDPSEWSIATAGQGTFEITTEQDQDLLDYMGAMASATADNGFVEFSGIHWLINPPVQAQETTVEYVGGTTNGAINCSTLDEVWVNFNQRYRAFNVDETYVEVSIDGGTVWNSFQINDAVVTNAPAIQGEMSVDVSVYAANQGDVRIRFRWKSDYVENNPDATQVEINSYGAGYGWMIDDVSVSSPIENNITIGETWYQNFFEIQEQAAYLDTDLMAAVEYHTQPDYSNRAFNFACAVTNAGILDQTNVKLIVTVTDPDGETTTEGEIESPDGFTLTAGSTDTLRIYGVMPSVWNDPVAGTYQIDFRVEQSEDDEFDGNNVGVSLFTRITEENSADGQIIMLANSNTVTPNTTTTNLEDNAIHANRYSFKEETTDQYAIVGIQFALQDETQAGEEIRLNVRQGSVTEEESEDNVMNEFFSYDPNDENVLSYVTDAADFTTTSTPVWITYDFMESPIIIESDIIYQAEIMIPQLGQPYCRVGATTGRASTVGVFFNLASPSTGPQGWNAWATVAYDIRFKTALYTSVENITVEEGVVLTQNYPNPFTNDTRIQYKLEETTTASLEVYDMAGKLVFGDDLGVVAAGAANSYMFNKGSLASGVYTYSIVTENARVTRKMVIE